MSADTAKLIAQARDQRVINWPLAKQEALLSSLAAALEAATEPTCPNCGIPLKWCRGVTSNPEHCWRWDYERFDETATALEAAEAQRDTLAAALDWIEAEPEDPVKVQLWARAALAAVEPPEEQP